MSNAMVWGAGGGIGKALVQHLVVAGWETVAISRNTAGLDALTPHVIQADPADAFAVQQAVMLAAQTLGEVDLWIYAAGDIASARVGDMAQADWQRLMDANLTGPFITTHHSLPLLAADAHLIYLGAVSERLRLPGLAAYAAAKAGLEAFAEALGKEERKRRVTVVRPGAVETALWDKVPLRLPKGAMSPADLAVKILDAHPSGHKGTLDV